MGGCDVGRVKREVVMVVRKVYWDGGLGWGLTLKLRLREERG